MNESRTSTLFSRFTSALTLWARTDCGTVMRPNSGTEPSDRPSDSYYIESLGSSGPKFSCSFVEFDGMGDYLLFEQHESAWKQLIALAKNSTVLLVIYCHGWKNNSQSSDVQRFNAFLCQLASTKWVGDNGFRVHGVFLAWRGASMKPVCALTADRELSGRMHELFGAPIVDSKWSQWLPRWLSFVPEQATYWGRKAAAEDDVSGAPISRTIFSLAYVLDRRRSPKRPHRVILLGHSMGALMLEQSLANASISKVMADWRWFTDFVPPGAEVLPFDLILLLNSAAPSIYAKEMRDFLAADYIVRKESGYPRPERPVIISVTSSADGATGVFHRIGNLFSPLSPKLQREYSDPHTNEQVSQSYFYSRTPGHNPLLINRFAKAAELPPLAPDQDPFEANLEPVSGTPWAFYTSPHNSSGSAFGWKFVKAPEHPSTVGASWRDKANYWIINVPRALIHNHGDIWSQQCMEMMIALWRMAEKEGNAMSKKPKSRPKSLSETVLESNLPEDQKKKALTSLEALKSHVPRLTEEEVNRIADATADRLLQAWKKETSGRNVVEPKETELKAKLKSLAGEIGIAILGSAAWELLFWVFTQFTSHQASASQSPEDPEFARKRAELAEQGRAGLLPDTVTELNAMNQLIYYTNIAIMEDIKAEFSGDPDFIHAARQMKKALLASDNFEDFEFGSFFQDIWRSMMDETVRKKVSCA